MIIRRATVEDLDRLVNLARLEHAASRMSKHPFDEACVRQSFTGAIGGMGSAVFVSETDGQVTGLIAGIVHVNLFNKFLTAYELLWFSLDGSGMKLLAALKNWANKMRCIEFVVHNYAGIVPAERFNKAMKRKGFDLLGATFVVTLEN